MIDLKFPDGSSRSFEDGATGRAVAASISPSLEKKALLVKLDGELLDLDRPLPHGGAIEIVTREAPEALDIIRHDTAHVLAEAVQELFPGTQVTIGPNVEDGFYYDFARNEPFSPGRPAEDRAAHARDRRPRREDQPRGVGPRRGDRALQGHRRGLQGRDHRGHPRRRADHGLSPGRTGRTSAAGRTCPRRKHVGKAFKLTKLAGAYWRGDQRNAQLQRIYGTAWASEADLEAYLKRLEEAEKRDHRKLGAAMDLFHIQEEGKGMVFWHPKGWTLYRTLVDYMRRRRGRGRLPEVKTPQILDRSLWERSGHWEKFHADMFVCETDEGETLAVKPMNCPGHIQIFNHGQRSYRDLPLRMAEFEGLHRYERSGGLHGLMRVRALAQDDGHIFCREDQIEARRGTSSTLLNSVYADLGVELHSVKLALRPDAARRHRRDVGHDRGDAGARGARRRARVRDPAGRGRLLCAEAGVPPEGRHRPHLAVRHAAARHGDARAAGRRPTSARTAPSTGR